MEERISVTDTTTFWLINIVELWWAIEGVGRLIEYFLIPWRVYQRNLIKVQVDWVQMNEIVADVRKGVFRRWFRCLHLTHLNVIYYLMSSLYILPTLSLKKKSICYSFISCNKSILFKCIMSMTLILSTICETLSLQYYSLLFDRTIMHQETYCKPLNTFYKVIFKKKKEW